MSEKRSRDMGRRRDRRKIESTGRSFLQAPIILDRRERSESSTQTPSSITTASESDQPVSQATSIPQQEISSFASLPIPFLRRPNKFNTESILKVLVDHPGHFVIGILGKQGVGKSTILSHFTQHPHRAFPTQGNDQFLYQGHKTDGIDMYITPERAILLDTEPIQSWTVLDKVLRNGSLGGVHPDLWLEMENLYNVIFMMSVCNVLMFVSDGPEVDMDLLRLIQRAEMLKFCIPDFPLLVGQQDLNYYPDIVFVCNKCTPSEFTCKKYYELQAILQSFFEDSQLKTQDLVDLGRVLLFFKIDRKSVSNLFFLPDQNIDHSFESFDVLVAALRDQVIASPRRPGKKGQVSEKDWYRNAVKTFDIIRKSDYISEYLQIVRKLRDS